MRLRVQTIEGDHAISPIHIVADGRVLHAMEFGGIERKRWLLDHERRWTNR